MIHVIGGFNVSGMYKSATQTVAKRWERFRATPGVQGSLASEREQAIIRIAIGIIGYGYYLAHQFAGSAPGNYGTAVWFGILFLLLSGSILYWTTRYGNVLLRTRRVASIILDTGTVSLGLALYGDVGLPLYPVYLWVIIGNGFRFGVPALGVSTLASLTGFGIAAALNPDLRIPGLLVPALAFALVLIPSYIATLLRKLDETIRFADAANQAKSVFLANMSHELRTPLYSIVGGVDCLSNTRLNLEQRGLLDSMHTSSHALLALISDILDLAKIEARKFQMSTEDFDLHALIRGVIQILATEADRKGIALRSIVDPALPFQLNGDVHHIRQVFLNLLGNAVKFTSEGYVEVRALARDLTDKGVTLRIEVEDTGVGIAPEAQQRIFDAFSQASASTSRHFGGAGLGTTIAKHIVETLGGSIGLESRAGHGSVFWFEVPLAIRTENTAHIERLHNARVLLITSPGPDHDLILSALSDWGVKATITGSPSEGLIEANEAAANSLPFHVVILNKSLIDVNHLQVADALRVLGTNARPMLILVDHQGQNKKHLRELTDHGYQSVLRSPVDKTMLYNAIHASRALETSDGIVDLATYQNTARGRQDTRILVVDDNSASLAISTEILRRGGYKVTAVSDAETALDELEENQFDLVVTDLRMPRIDGKKLMELYRFIYPDRPVPFVFLTADATTEAREDARNAGAEGFLTKPVPAGVILKTVHRLIAAKRSRAAVPHE